MIENLFVKIASDAVPEKASIEIILCWKEVAKTLHPTSFVSLLNYKYTLFGFVSLVFYAYIL